MVSGDNVTVTLTGGAPWGFRLTGGGALPLEISKVRHVTQCYNWVLVCYTWLHNLHSDYESDLKVAEQHVKSVYPGIQQWSHIKQASGGSGGCQNSTSLKPTGS